MTAICNRRKWFRRGGPVCPPGFLKFPVGHPLSRKIAFSFCRGGSRTAPTDRAPTPSNPVSGDVDQHHLEPRRRTPYSNLCKGSERYLPGCVRSPQTANASFLTLSSRRRRRIEGRGESNASRRARGHPSIRGSAATQDEAERTFSTAPYATPATCMRGTLPMRCSRGCTDTQVRPYGLKGTFPLPLARPCESLHNGISYATSTFT